MDRSQAAHRGSLKKEPRGELLSFQDGVHLLGTPLYFDAWRKTGLCFLSNGLSSQPPRRPWPKKILCTALTLELLKLGRKNPPGEALLSPFGRPFSLGGLRLELFPSGYLPGAASLLVTLGAAGPRIIYSGPLRRSPGFSCEPQKLRAADILVSTAPLASLASIDRALPTVEEAKVQLIKEADRALAEGICAIFVAPAPGAAQDLAELFDAEGKPTLVHPRILAIRRILLKKGDVPKGTPYAGTLRAYRTGSLPTPASLLLWPLGEPLEKLLARIAANGGRPRLHVCTAAALCDKTVSRSLFGPLSALADVVPFPYPDAIDREGFLTYVRASEAREVYLTEGYSDALARTLAQSSVQLFPLGPPRQLELFPT